MASDLTSFDMPPFAKHDLSQHHFPDGMLEMLIEHKRRHPQLCSCIADKYKKSYRKEENDGVTWCRLKKAVELALYESIKPEILQLNNRKISPMKIAKLMTEKYGIPYKRPGIKKILSETNHQDNDALRFGQMAATLQSLDQPVIPNSAAIPRAQTLVDVMEWDLSEISLSEDPNLPFLMGFGTSNVDNGLHGMHDENDLTVLREQVRGLQAYVGTQNDKIAALEIKARKLTELKDEAKELRVHAAQLKVYQQWMEECHRFRHI